MAGKRRHWKEKNGRFWARVAVPENLQSILKKSELIEPLGGDLRTADRNHAAAVARLQGQIEQANRQIGPKKFSAAPSSTTTQITDAERDDLAWTWFTATLERDAHKRAAMPTQSAIDAELERILQRMETGEADTGRSLIAHFNVYTEYELMAGARHFDANLRRRRLAALETSLASADTRPVDAAVQQYVDEKKIDAPKGSAAWHQLAALICRAEIAALKQTLQHDLGDYTPQALDPVLKPPASPNRALPVVPLKELFYKYIANRQSEGTHLDGGAIWEPPIDSLIKFLGHNDARKLSKDNLIEWRDFLLASGMSSKTVSAKYLAAIRAVLNWASTESHLPTNEALYVRQEVAKKSLSREKGYTTAEAVKILNASIGYKQSESSNPAHRENTHLINAKRWVPLLCAFSGARVTEMTQLRKEDFRAENDRWILRITPEAGSVKTGDYRDVPLHNQVLDLGFIDFLNSMNSGPLFHSVLDPKKILAGARVTSGKISEWLQSSKLVPLGVQPSHGWRHRFKTLSRELGVSDRVVDAIQGHASKTKGDDYGDVTIKARLKVIDAFPYYDLKT
jgi:integrase